MAKSVPNRPRMGAGSWSIFTPAPNQAVPLNPDDTVTVVVDDEGSGNTGYLAAVYSGMNPPAAPTSPTDPAYTPLTTNDQGATYSGNVPVTFAGVFQSHQNVVVYPLPSLTNSQGNAFTLTVPASGSGLAGGVLTGCCANLLIPLWVYAHVSGAGPLNGVYTLVYDATSGVWNSDAVCGSHGFRLQCVAPNWQLTVKGPPPYPADPTSKCSPLQILFNNVDLNTPGCGGTATAAVEILVSP